MRYSVGMQCDNWGGELNVIFGISVYTCWTVHTPCVWFHLTLCVCVGLRPMCSGIKPSMLRASIYSGVQFVTYEAVKDYFLAETDWISMAMTSPWRQHVVHQPRRNNSMRYFTLMNPGTLPPKNAFFFRNDYRHGNVHATRLQISKTMHKLDWAGTTGMDAIHTWRWHGYVILSTDADAMPVMSHANRGTSDNRKTAVDKWLPLWGAQ